eukprot:1941915-Alexandrium_andersonii.AAC.1
MLARLRSSRGVNAVQLLRPTRAVGRLLALPPGHRPSRCVVSFEEIERAFELAAFDREMLLGSAVIRRLGGWPMGGSLSEPATLVAL